MKLNAEKKTEKSDSNVIIKHRLNNNHKFPATPA